MRVHADNYFFHQLKQQKQCEYIVATAFQNMVASVLPRTLDIHWTTLLWSIVFSKNNDTLKKCECRKLFFHKLKQLKQCEYIVTTAFQHMVASVLPRTLDIEWTTLLWSIIFSNKWQLKNRANAENIF
jgi:hypothetical protein